MALHFDTVFLGVEAIDETGRCMVGVSAEAGLTKAMLRSGARKVLLADHTKAESQGYIAYGTLRDFDTWITTPGIKEKQLKKFSEFTHIMEAVR